MLSEIGVRVARTVHGYLKEKHGRGWSKGAPPGPALKKYREEIGARVTYSACAEKYLEEVGVQHHNA